MIVVALPLSATCCRAPRSIATQQPTDTRVTKETPTAVAVTPLPTDTAEISTRVPSATPTATRQEEPTATTVPPSESPTQAPTATFTPRPPTATPLRATDARVIHHNGFSQGGIGVHERGAFPWLDLLVRLGGTWYGPEREPDDGIHAVPSPERLRWEAGGDFGTLPNGEAWWTESGTVGTARLVDVDGAVLVELPLQITFRGGRSGGGDGEPGLPPTPT
jgi:hypothetical protein